jgi:hypothetical protein
MFSTFLEKLSGFFDKHWLLRYFFPSLAFWAAGLAVYGSARGIAEPLRLWHRQPTEVQVILFAGTLLWVTLFAYLVANFGTALIRLFEGYWEHPPLKWLRKPRQAYYEKRFQYLESALKLPQVSNNPRERQSLERELLLLFPRGRDREKSVMPTRLGNIIRAAEIYPLERYGADAVLLWPRLQPFLPAEFIEALNGAQTAMEIMLVLSALSFLFSLIACWLVAALTLDWGLFGVCTAGFILAWICYRNSLHGALGYAELIKTAFDLYRGKLLEGLALEPPSNPEDERKVWDDVSQRIFRNIPFSTARFKGTPAPKPQSRHWFGEALKELFALVRVALAPAPPPSRAPAAPNPIERPYDFFPLAYFGILLPLCLVTAGIMGCRAQRPVSRVTLARSMPAYRLLSDQDLRAKDTPRSEVPSDAVKYPHTVSGRSYLMHPLAKGSILRKSEIRPVDPKQLAGMVAIGIPTTAAAALGGELRPGDSVDLAISPAKDAPPPFGCGLTNLTHLLVLDVKRPGRSASLFVVVLAVPPACKATLAGAAGRISLVREL